jgi:hypothetical protein
MSNLESTIDFIKKLSPQQMVSVITIIGFCFTVFFWVENRYANLKQTEENIERMLNTIIQIDSKLTATINQFPEDKIKKIDEGAKKQEETIKSFMRK